MFLSEEATGKAETPAGQANAICCTPLVLRDESTSGPQRKLAGDY